jgi:predicted SprT family Zn-dependent metalloprotease
MKGLDADQIVTLLGIVTRQQKSEIDNKIAECLEIANQTFPLGGSIKPGHVNPEAYNWPEVAFDLKGRVAGQAWGDRKIRLNIELLHKHYDEMLHQTLPHEISHCVVSRRWPRANPHGYEWKQVMRVFGLPPNRTHMMPTTKARHHPRPHIYICEGCLRQFKLTNNIHRKMQNGQKRYCTRCKSRVVYIRSEV